MTERKKYKVSLVHDFKQIKYQFNTNVFEASTGKDVIIYPEHRRGAHLLYRSEAHTACQMPLHRKLDQGFTPRVVTFHAADTGLLFIQKPSAE